ncbi:MAG: hypothetical protein KTR31_31035 [Myxococcales bacterium]|nr:hypothetical protein [Myxococcales bacterium]
MSLLDRGLQSLRDRFGEVREQRIDGHQWLRVWSVGDATFCATDTAEFEETGALSRDTLMQRGWPVEDGVGFVDFLPILPVLGELSVPDTEDLLGAAWADGLYDFVVLLPCAAHLLDGHQTRVDSHSGDGWRLFTHWVHTPAQLGATRICTGLRRDEDTVLGALLAGEDAEHEVGALLDISAADLTAARKTQAICRRPW